MGAEDQQAVMGEALERQPDRRSRHSESRHEWELGQPFTGGELTSNQRFTLAGRDARGLRVYRCDLQVWGRHFCPWVPLAACAVELHAMVDARGYFSSSMGSISLTSGLFHAYCPGSVYNSSLL